MKKAIILFNLGGPDKLENVEPFLFNLLMTQRYLTIEFFRYPLARMQIEEPQLLVSNGGSSPILRLTEDQECIRIEVK